MVTETNVSLLCFSAAMKVASFNIQKFGKNKLSDPEILNILIKVTNRNNNLNLYGPCMYVTTYT